MQLCMLQRRALPLQTFFLTAKHRQMLKEEEGIESWHFEQHANEAVFIPAGCPHQVWARSLAPLLHQCWTSMSTGSYTQDVS